MSLAAVLQRCAQPTAWPIDLPLLTCQAVGGDPRQAVMVAAAFELARLAARVLDDVEAVTIMTQAGAAHYLLAVAESHCREAIAALDRARGDPVAHQSLLDLLPDVLPAAGEKKHS